MMHMDERCSCRCALAEPVPAAAAAHLLARWQGREWDGFVHLVPKSVVAEAALFGGSGLLLSGLLGCKHLVALHELGLLRCILCLPLSLLLCLRPHTQAWTYCVHRLCKLLSQRWQGAGLCVDGHYVRGFTVTNCGTSTGADTLTRMYTVNCTTLASRTLNTSCPKPEITLNCKQCDAEPTSMSRYLGSVIWIFPADGGAAQPCTHAIWVLRAAPFGQSCQRSAP